MCHHAKQNMVNPLSFVSSNKKILKKRLLSIIERKNEKMIVKRTVLIAVIVCLLGALSLITLNFSSVSAKMNAGSSGNIVTATTQNPSNYRNDQHNSNALKFNIQNKSENRIVLSLNNIDTIAEVLSQPKFKNSQLIKVSIDSIDENVIENVINETLSCTEVDVSNIVWVIPSFAAHDKNDKYQNHKGNVEFLFQ